MPSSDLAEGAKILGDHRTHRPPKERPGFWPFIPDRREFPIRSWQELVSRRYRMSRHEDLTYDHATGLPELRELIATNLSTSRGVQCTPDQVVVTNGGQAALDLIFRLILKAGDHVWCEDPGYSGALGAARAMGAVIDPLEVAPETGWTLEPSPETAPKAIYLTPTCQQAFCHIMPQEQRNWLVDYAARHDSWIIEDDFDNEFRPPQSAVPALQGLDGGRRTFYVGTFAKTMFPALRIGYAVVPKPFVAAMADAVFVSGHIANLTMQAALFDFITGGGFARHTARMRRLYERRKLRMLDLITDQLSDWLDPRPQPIGLAVPTLLRGDLRDMDIVHAANKHGLRLPALSSRYHFVAPRQGFLLGYCAMTETELSRNVGALRQIFEETCDRSVP